VRLEWGVSEGVHMFDLSEMFQMILADYRQTHNAHNTVKKHVINAHLPTPNATKHQQPTTALTLMLNNYIEDCFMH